MCQDRDYFKKYVYNFNINKTDGGDHLKSILGNKGAGLAEMCKMKIPVPPGFTISTEICNIYSHNSTSLPKYLKQQVITAVKELERLTESKLGDTNNPLLLSVRSGSQISMPGMMDTILNLGLNDITVEGLVKKTRNSWFVYDCYRRYIEMYSHVVLGIDKSNFENIFENKKIELGIKEDQDLATTDIKRIIDEYKDLVLNNISKEFPQDIEFQLWSAIIAVCQSWDTPRAVRYREINGIPHDIGTAVNIQSMVFGNKGKNSATGVVFTRNPSTGAKEIFGEFMLNAQGEDVVSGIRTPNPINIYSKKQFLSNLQSMEELMPQAYNELRYILKKLELHYKDMQDVEFTIEEGRCWILQTRSGKCSITAAIKIAMDMLNEGILEMHQVLNNIDPLVVEKILHPSIDPKSKKNY